MGIERREAVIVGGGQAGLSTAYELTRRGVDVAVLEAGHRTGDAWRRRWDSLRLFTPARYDALPGLAFPAPPGSYPGKDAMADYLETYARAMALPVRTGVRVGSLTRNESTYILETTEGRIETDNVVVAAGHERPSIPDFAASIDPSVKQLHTKDYRNPNQLTGDVLVVGAGNSGVEIAIESAAAGHRTTLAGPSTGAIPAFVYSFGGRIFWFYARRIASVDTPIGRKMRPLVLTRGAPLIRLKLADAAAAGVERGPRVARAEDGVPVLEDGRRLRSDTIVWCTGFRPDYSWIALPAAFENGVPRHNRGVAEGEPGLYFVGLPFQTRLASAVIGGVALDARFIAEAITTRLASQPSRSYRPEPAFQLGEKRG
jgi:putative flavoprotein involved in K+ transport